MQRNLAIWVSVVSTALALGGTAGAAPAGATWVGEPQAVQESQEAWAAFGALTAYKSRMSGAAGGGFEMIMEWVKPNRMRLAFGGPEPGEFIIIEGVRWSNSRRGCARLPGNIRIPAPDITPDKPLEGTITVARAPALTIDGVATSAYDVVMVSSSSQTRMRTYVDPRTKMFKRWEVESDQGKVNIDYLEFNGNVAINPPC